jgi:hypothetical protein
VLCAAIAIEVAGDTVAVAVAAVASAGVIAYGATHVQGYTTDASGAPILAAETNNGSDSVEGTTGTGAQEDNQQASAPLQDLVGRTTPYKGRSDDLDYTGHDSAEAEFERVASPDSVGPHPDPRLAAAGGKIGSVPGGGTIGYRPTSRETKTPALDLHNVPGLPQRIKIKWPKPQ